MAAHSSSPLLAFLLQREEHYPIFDRICALLDIGDIISVTRTCKRLSNLYQTLLATQWNVDRSLRRFVDDPCLFRSKLGEYDALVSGSFALQYFDRVIWPESDLDIFLPDTHEEGFGEYLCTSEGYICNKRGRFGCEDYSDLEDREVRTYIRCKQANGRETKIQTIALSSLPIKVILQNFYTSAVVNIITWNKAYALFPLPTFIHRKTYVLQKLNDYRGAQLLKYGQRGWKIQGTLWPEEETPSHPFQARRRIGDKFTWTIPFNTLNIRHSSTPDSVLEYSFFSVNTTDNDYDGLSTRYEVLASEFFACTLRHRYTFAGEPNSCFWLQLVGKRVGKLTFIEILKLKREDRVTHFQNYPDLDYSRLRDELTSRETLPETWTFYDDEIPKWHKAWEQGRMEKMIE